MSKIQIARLSLVAAACALAAPFASAADNQNLTVQATVTGACKLTSVPTMSFALDPGVVPAGNKVTQTSSIVVKCTKNTNTAGSTFTIGGQVASTTVTLNTAPVGDTIPVALTWPAPGNFAANGFGALAAGTTVVVTGEIQYNDYANVSAGNYSGTVAVVIAP